MRKTSLSKANFLPSLLDRVTDDDYLNSTLEKSKHRVDQLEKKLANKTDDFPDDKKNKLIEELKTQRGQFSYLQRTIGTLDKITDCVKRDLSWLLNSQNMCMDKQLEDSFPNVESSVLNYGMPDLTGKTASGIKIFQLERTLKQVILRFEPRIIPRTLKVKLHEDETLMDHNALIFEIIGDLWAEPVPIHLQLMTQLDLESGDVELNEYL